MRCPTCGSFAVPEPAGIRCLLYGHWVFFRRALPRDHASGYGGWDWKARARQSAIDASFRHPGRAVEIVQALLERLEGKPKKEPVPA